jgi:transposase
VLARRRLAEGVAGLAQLHALIADHLGVDDEPASVLVGIETDRGPWVQTLIATGYTVYPINPLQVARYRQRHGTSGAKSDPADAHVLAEIVRTDRAHHRAAAGGSTRAEAVKTLARTHQSMIWMRQRQANQLRSLLREFYPAALVAFGDDLAGRDALAVLAVAATPQAGRALTTSRIAAALRRAGRQRNTATRADQILAALRSEQLGLPEELTAADGASLRSLVAVLRETAAQVEALEAEVSRCLASTRTLRSSPASPGSVSCSAPGCSPSSATTRTASPTPKPAATTPAPARSPKPPAPAGSSWPATPATAASPTRCTSKPSPR